MQRVVFQEQIEYRRVKLRTFFHARRDQQEPARTVAPHIQPAPSPASSQTLGRQQTFHLGRDARLGQFGHNEMVEFVIYHALAIKLFNAR